MPDVDGLAVCRVLRAEGDRTPVLMLTARVETPDRVAGLDAGADDYLRQAVRPRRAARSPAGAAAPGAPRGAGPRGRRAAGRATLRVDPAGPAGVAGRARAGAVEDRVRPAGAAGAQRRASCSTTPRSTSAIWGYDFGADSKNLAVYICYLRRKLAAAGDRKLIHTVRGVGYAVRGPAVSLRTRFALVLSPSSAPWSRCWSGALSYRAASDRITAEIDRTLVVGHRRSSSTARPRCSIPRRRAVRATVAAVDAPTDRSWSPRPWAPTARSPGSAAGPSPCRSPTSPGPSPRRRATGARSPPRSRSAATPTASSRPRSAPAAGRCRWPSTSARPARVLGGMANQIAAVSVAVLLAAAAAGWLLARRITRRSGAARRRRGGGQRLGAGRPGGAGGRARRGGAAVGVVQHDARPPRRRPRGAGPAGAGRGARTAHAAHQPAHQRQRAAPHRRALPDARDRLVADVQGETRELSHLVDELVELALSGRDDEPEEPVELAAVVRRAAERVGPAHRPGDPDRRRRVGGPGPPPGARTRGRQPAGERRQVRGRDRRDGGR